MTVEWEEGFSIRVDFEKDKKISRQAEFFRLTAVLSKKSAVRRNFSA